MSWNDDNPRRRVLAAKETAMMFANVRLHLLMWLLLTAMVGLAPAGRPKVILIMTDDK